MKNEHDDLHPLALPAMRLAHISPHDQGFSDDGEKGEAVAFNLKTLKVTHRIPAAADADADADADGITRDPATGCVFVANGDSCPVTVIDPRSDAAVATVKAGEKLEYLAPDPRYPLRASHSFPLIFATLVEVVLSV